MQAGGVFDRVLGCILAVLPAEADISRRSVNGVGSSGRYRWPDPTGTDNLERDFVAVTTPCNAHNRFRASLSFSGTARLD